MARKKQTDAATAETAELPEMAQPILERPTSLEDRLALYGIRILRETQSGEVTSYYVEVGRSRYLSAEVASSLSDSDKCEAIKAAVT